MSARAAAAEATKERVLDAAVASFRSGSYEDVTVRAVASDAGVALQTVLNHFRTKEDLAAAAFERIGADIARGRWDADTTTLRRIAEVVVDDYERNGDMIMRMLSIEDRFPSVGPIVATGRRGHEEWVEHVLADALEGLDRRARRRRLGQLVVVTDVYSWKLLRRDKCLGKTETIEAMRELLAALHPTKEG